MPLGLLAIALTVLQVDGLRAGESVVGVSKSSPSDVSVRGRVIDGCTGLPIAGAKVELWAELSGIAPELVCLTSTRIDGSFVESAQLPSPVERYVDKVIVRAPGYRSTCLGRAESEILLLPLAKHIALRVADLDGKPIAGARAESRQTCAHAPPAFVGTSDAKGVVDMSTCPAFDDDPEFVVSARGYGAVYIDNTSPLLAPGGLEVRLPRRRPVSFHVVDAAGAPLAERRFGFGFPPRWCTGTSDTTGRIEFDSPFLDRKFGLSLQEGDRGVVQAFGRAPSTLEPLLVFDKDWSEEKLAEDTSVPVHVVDPENRPLDLSVGVLREKGSTQTDLDGVERLGKDWGPTTLIAGGPFTGGKETVKVLEGPVETTLVVTREPVLTIQLPADEYWLVHVQAGDDSITLDGPKFPLRQPVPAGKAITICAVGNEETRVAQLGHIDEDRAVDMTRTSSVLEQARAPRAPVAHRWVVDEPGLRGHVRLCTGQIEWSDLHGAVEFQAPADANFEALVGASGCVPRVLDPWNAAETTITLRHRGSLLVRGADLVALYAGGEQGDATADGGFRVDDLAPGPLIAEIARAKGEVVTVSLVLGDGEHRELTLR